MTKIDGHIPRATAIVALLLLASATLRVLISLLPMSLALDGVLTWSRTGIIAFLFIWWGISVSRRIIARQTRRDLVFISILAVFWLSVRSVKYYIVPATAFVSHYFWYLYYIPMLLIPLLFLYTALSLGKGEEYMLPRWVRLLLAPTVALILLVLTNDLHQFVFRFDLGMLYNSRAYTHMAGYYVVAAWIVLCMLAAIVVLVKNNHTPQSKTVLWLPVVPLLLAIIWAICHLFGLFSDTAATFPYGLFRDISIMLPLFAIAIIESCIQVGLIQANTGYAALFHATDTPAVVTDGDYRVRFVSGAALEASVEKMRQAEAGPVDLGNGLLLKSMDVSGGHILWTEDMSEVLALQEELVRTARELAEEKDLLEAEVALREKRAITDTRNRLYSSRSTLRIARASRSSLCWKALRWRCRTVRVVTSTWF